DGIRDLIVTGVQTCALPISGATVAVGRRSGLRAGAHRADLGQAAGVDPGDAAAAGPDGVQVDGRGAHRKAGDLALVDARRPSIRSEERRVGKGARGAEVPTE